MKHYHDRSKHIFIRSAPLCNALQPMHDMHRDNQRRDHNPGENGHVLFLMLFAFILFFALAYAVMHGFSGQDKEKHDIRFHAGAAITQYSSAMRTGVARLLLRDVPLDQIDFSRPDPHATQQAQMIFSPAGGGVSFRDVPKDSVTKLDQASGDYTKRRNGNWHFVSVQVNQIGTTKKDFIAVLDKVKKSLCEEINYQVVGYSAVPKLSVSMADILQGIAVLQGQFIDGQSFLCVRANDGYFYYHVLAEQ